MPTVRDDQGELAAEERKLARMLKAEPTGNAETITAATSKLKATAERVKHLRAQVSFPRPSAARAEAMAERDRRAERRKRKEPARTAATKLRAFAHPELVGASLNVSRLSEGEGKELLELVEARYEGSLSDRKERRYRALVGKLAGDPGLFERSRKAREAEAAEAEAAERARLDAIPLRRFEGKGGAFLPGYLLDWLLGSEEGSFAVVDVAVLGTIVLALEQGRSPFARSEFRDGAIVLDNATGFTFLPCMNPDGDLGERRVRDAVVFLAGNDWLEIGSLDGRTSIGLGSRARKLLEEATAEIE